MDEPNQNINTTPSHFGIKRRRLILSCLECKRRKLKCDRSTPACSRCRQIGRAAYCSYDQRFSRASESVAEDESSATHGLGETSGFPESADSRNAERNYLPTPSGPSPANEVPKSRDELLSTEQLLDQNLPHLSADREAGAVTGMHDAETRRAESQSTQLQQGPDHIIFRGKGFKTQFYGASHHWYPVGVLSNFHDIHHYFKDVLEQEPRLVAVARNIGRLRDTTKTAEHAERMANAPVILPLLLPDRATCQVLMELYFEYVGCIYSVLHRPTFWRQFSDYWLGKLDEPLPFVAIMLAAMACSRCLKCDNVARYEGASSAGRQQATTWINAVDKWLAQQSQKNTTIVSYQIPCLVFEARRANSIKIKRHYSLAQNLVSNALAAGFHRDPVELGPNTTPFEREMRRRVWSTVLEYELGAAIARGLPAMSPGLHASCQSPSNVCDNDLSPGKSVRQEHEESVFTESSYLRFADKTRALRNTLNNLVNDPKRHIALPYNTILEYHAQITSCLKDMPAWTTSAEGVEGNSIITAKGMTGLKLRKMLFLLHLPFAAQQSVEPSFKHSRFVCHEVAYDVLQIHKEASAGGEVCALLYARSDVVRAGICICLMELDRPQVQQTVLLDMQRRFQLDQMELMLDLVETRILRLGVGFKGYWMLLAASCYEEAMREGPSTTTWRAKVIDRCASLYYKVAASQPPHLAVANVGAETPGTMGATSTNTTELMPNRLGSQPINTSFDLSFGDIGGLGWPDWSFEDMEFFSLADA